MEQRKEVHIHVEDDSIVDEVCDDELDVKRYRFLRENFSRLAVSIEHDGLGGKAFVKKLEIIKTIPKIPPKSFDKALDKLIQEQEK